VCACAPTARPSVREGAEESCFPAKRGRITTIARPCFFGRRLGSSGGTNRRNSNSRPRQPTDGDERRPRAHRSGARRRRRHARRSSRERARRTSGRRDVFRRASPVSVRGSHRRVERKRIIDATSLRKCRDVGGRDRRGFGSLRAFAVHLRRDSEGGPPEERRDALADARGGLAAPGVLHAHQHALGAGVEHA
jgi:hypothetical protein